MPSDPSIRAQGYQYFLQEAPELIQVLEQGLVTLKDDSSINKINTLMRATHTLKGAAASLELAVIAKVAHSLEDVFRALCRPNVSIEPEVEALLFEGFECLRAALRVELTQTVIDEDEILNRTAAIFTQLQNYLGNCFDQDVAPPTSAELGFDVTQSIFEVGVTQRLNELTAALASAPPADVLTTLKTQADVFLGLSESLSLPGFGAIAAAAIAAVEQYPDQVTTIAALALADFEQGQAAVLAGDRSQGGQLSEALQAFAQGQAQPPASEAPDPPEALFAESIAADPVAEPLPTTSEDPVELPPISLLQAEAAAEAPIDKASSPESGVISVHKVFQWMRRSMHGPAQSGAVPSGDVQPTDSLPQETLASSKAAEGGDGEVDAPVTALENGGPKAGPEADSEADHPETGPEDSPAHSSDNYIDSDAVDIDGAMEVPSVSPAATAPAVDDHNGPELLESIWGGATPPDAEPLDQEFSTPKATLEATPGVTPEPVATPTHDALSVAGPLAANESTATAPSNEPLPLQTVARPLNPTAAQNAAFQRPRDAGAQGATPSRSPAQPTPTVRVQIEQLDQLNYAIGELLTNHNQQSLQADQIQAAMRRLYAQLQQHQQRLGHLQDWIDQLPAQPDTLQGDRGGSQTAWPRPFQAEAFAPAESAASPMDHFDVLELDQYSEPQLAIQALLDDMVQLTEAADAVDLFTQQSRQTHEKQGRLLFQTRDILIEGRMFPLGQLLERFYGVLQQLETLHHKPVTLTLVGSETLVDKAIAEKLYDPILHLVRNAFDHGIEPVAVRQQRHKPQAGQLEITARHQGKHLVIEVCDDGGGIDLERIRQRAIAQQRVSPEQAYRLSPAQLTDLLFEPGFSTADQISSLSGRGVGLDVVRAQLRELEGEVAVTSATGEGTTFTLRIPLRLTIAKLLLCQAGMKTYALLPDAVEQIIIPRADQIQQRQHCRALWWGEGDEASLVPIYNLSELLEYHEQTQHLPTQTAPAKDRAPQPHVLLIRQSGGLLGLEVDQMLGEQELVIRPLNPLLQTHPYLFGASILADGQLTLVIDGAVLTAGPEAVSSTAGAEASPEMAAVGSTVGANRLPAAPPALEPRALPPTDPNTSRDLGQKLLVVDDSVTTRQTLALTLQRHGYQVIQAQDGQDAVEQLCRYNNVQLVVCDIEMPRMNGFEFLQHCQFDPVLSQTPVIMLSSRSSTKHRRLAEQLGAIAYVSKPYLEPQLLAMIAEVLTSKTLNPVSG
ncbi:MAG: response regulator [Cyanobacteria bacterium P01_A01_bin.135]